MSRILVTGGAGFIGYHLANRLSNKKNHEIYVVDNLSRGSRDTELSALINKRNVKFIEADLTRGDSYKLLNGSYDYVYHFAGVVGVKNTIRKPDRVLYVNIVSTLNLLEWIRMSQKGIKKLLFASTSEVYAGTLKHYGIPIPTDEGVNVCLDNVASSRTTYALSKIAGESACFNYSKYDIPFVIIRYHNVYGPRMGYSHVIPELILKARRSKKYLGVHSVNHTRTFCYVSDAIEATVNIAASKDSSGQIFNVGNDNEEITIGGLAKKIIGIINPALKIKPLSDESGSPSRRCPDINKLKRAINFQPKICLDKGIKLTWEWYRQH